MADSFLDKITSYPVEADGILGAGRDEITLVCLLPRLPSRFQAVGSYVADSSLDKIISYAVEADGILGAGRDEITAGLFRLAIALAFSGGRAYVAEARSR